RVKFELYRETWNTSLVQEGGRYRYNSTRRLDLIGKESTAALSAGRGTLRVTPPTGGAFVLVVTDEQTGAITSHPFYASNGAWDDNISRENPEQLDVVVTALPRGTIEAITDLARNFDAAAALRLWHGHVGTAAAQSKFRPGETAQVIVRSPFTGRLLLSVE